MAKKKKQHYVPKFYLKRFASNDKKIYLYDIEKDTFIFNGRPVPYKDQFYENYFYGEDKIWENRLNDLEQRWDISFSNVINNNYNNDDIDNIKEFAVYQYGRTIFQLNLQIENSAKLTNELLKIYLTNTNNENPQVLDMAEKLSKEKAKENITPAKLLNIFQKICDEVNDLEFKHITFDTKETFISSDNPITIINPYINNIGFGIIGLVILFPLSPNALCILYDKKIYPKINLINRVCKNEYIMETLNALFFVNAKSMIYSINLFSKKLFKQKNRKLWIKNIKYSNVSSIGNKKESFVEIRSVNIEYDKLPYFFMIDREYWEINSDFRTPVPRKFDADFQRKLRYEYLIIPNILSDSKIDLLDDQYISNYKREHNSYYLLIMKYWGINKILQTFIIYFLV